MFRSSWYLNNNVDRRNAPFFKELTDPQNVFTINRDHEVNTKQKRHYECLGQFADSVTIPRLESTSYIRDLTKGGVEKYRLEIVNTKASKIENGPVWHIRKTFPTKELAHLHRANELVNRRKRELGLLL